MALIGLVLVALVPMAPASAAAATITVSRGSVIGGETITVSGSTGQKKARQVVLQRQSGKTWINASFARSSAQGSYKFSYKPPTKSGTKTVVRVIAPKVKISGKTFAQITTGGRSVLTVGQGATISMPSAIARDQSFTIAGTFTPARTGRAVVAQKPTSSGGWVSVSAAVKQNSAGKVAIPMVLKVQGVYTFRVITLAAGGAAAVASLPLTIDVKAPLSAPPVPTGLIAQSGNASAQLAWNAVAAADLAGYNVYRRTNASEPWVKINSALLTATQYTAAPLTNGLSFQFSVTAVDTDGNESDKSGAVTVTPSAPVDNTPPDVPTNLTANPGNSSVQLAWTAVPQSDLAGYHVYRATNVAGPWTRLTTNTTSTTSYNASGLTNGTEYFFAVTSVDNSPQANESQKSAAVSATPAVAADTTPPPAPTGVSAVAGNASATVTWSAVTAADLDGYRVYRGTSAAGPWTDPVSVAKTSSNAVVTGLANGTTYYFAVTSFDLSDNESAKSAASAATVPQAGALVWSSVSAGVDHTCAIRSDGSLWCWGRNTWGQLGSAANIVTKAPARVGSLNTWTAVSAGDRFTCAVQEPGTMWCWGRNTAGQTGSTANLGTENTNQIPTQLGSATTWTSVSAGGSSACGLQGGTAWCWGLNLDGQLGKATNANTTTPNPAPSQVGSETTWSALSVGTDHTCGTRTGDTLWCWGSNLNGQLGSSTNVGTTAPNSAPLQVAGTWANASAGDGHTCAVRTNSDAYCWGENPNGELGKGANAGSNPTPSKITGTGWASTSAGGMHSCAVKTNGTAWCWGRNQFGQLGKTANAIPNPEPAQVAGTWQTIDTGYDHTAATTPSGTILTWGSNTFGQLGTTENAETQNPTSTPVLVPTP